MKVLRHVEIARDREGVHLYVANPLNDPEWCPKVLAVEVVDAAAGIYAVDHRPVPLLPARRMDHRLLESSPGRLLWREDDGTDVFTVTYTLEELAPATTRFTQRSEFELGAPRLLWPLMRLGIGRDIAAQLGRLKKVLESDTSP